VRAACCAATGSQGQQQHFRTNVAKSARLRPYCAASCCSSAATWSARVRSDRLSLRQSAVPMYKLQNKQCVKHTLQPAHMQLCQPFLCHHTPHTACTNTCHNGGRCPIRTAGHTQATRELGGICNLCDLLAHKAAQQCQGTQGNCTPTLSTEGVHGNVDNRTRAISMHTKPVGSQQLLCKCAHAACCAAQPLQAVRVSANCITSQPFRSPRLYSHNVSQVTIQRLCALTAKQQNLPPCTELKTSTWQGLSTLCNACTHAVPPTLVLHQTHHTQTAHTHAILARGSQSTQLDTPRPESRQHQHMLAHGLPHHHHGRDMSVKAEGGSKRCMWHRHCQPHGGRRVL
jgi:hypothetical protein